MKTLFLCKGEAKKKNYAEFQVCLSQSHLDKIIVLSATQ